MTHALQTLSETDRRLVAEWAAACATRVLWLFEAEWPDDGRPRAAIARTQAFARGDMDTAAGIRERFGGGGVRRETMSPAAAAAARSAGQASAVCHMGAHALGAAAYAIKAVGLAASDRPTAAEQEIRWQLLHMTPAVRSALRSLPPGRRRPVGPSRTRSPCIGSTGDHHSSAPSRP